jgi:flagellar biosynthesis protein FliO
LSAAGINASVWQWLRSDGAARWFGRLRVYVKARCQTHWKGHWKAPWAARRRVGRLRLVDSLGLGERRSVAVLEVEGRRFLVGTTPQAVTLLGELQPNPRSEEKAAASDRGESGHGASDHGESVA